MTIPLRFVNNKIDDYALQVTFDPVAGKGTVVYNLSLIKDEDLEYAISLMKDAHKTGVTVSGLVKFFASGERINGFVVPAGNTAICTICSITFDGLLIRRGIPVNPIGGGVVEIENRTPIRFTHIILYEHTTIDPLHVLDQVAVGKLGGRDNRVVVVNSHLYSLDLEAVRPDELHGGVVTKDLDLVLDELASSSYSGILEVGVPNLSLLGVPVSPQFVAIAAVGGTNPMAAIREGGRWVQTHAMKGLIDIGEMQEIRGF